MKKTIPLEIEFNGDGSFKKTNDSHFKGNVVGPNLKDNLSLNIAKLESDKDGTLNPTVPFTGNLQIDIKASKQGYRELAKFFLALSEIDLSDDQQGFFHHHLDDLTSEDQTSSLDLIFSRND